MSDLIINISWEYLLGILGSILALAYYTGSRFTRLESDVRWLSNTVRELTIRAENISTKLFAAHSPVSLTLGGQRHLEESGLKLYIDLRKDTLVGRLRAIPHMSVRIIVMHHMLAQNIDSLGALFATLLRANGYREGNRLAIKVAFLCLSPRNGSSQCN